MRFLKILGMVVALHVVLFTIFLLSPGCQSNPTTPAPTPGVASSEPAAPASTLAPMPVDEMGNYTSQPATRTAAATPSNPVSTTITSAPLPDMADTTGDTGRSAPSRPANPGAYVSTGSTLPTALNPTEHVIRAGDNLGKIAAKYGTTVSALQKANPGIKPQSLRVGQIVKLPANIAVQSGTPAGETGAGAGAAPGGARYTVRSGDSLSAIAARNGTTVSALRQANSLRSDTLQVGQTLIIPGVSSAAAPATSGYTPAPAPAAARVPSTISGDASSATVEHLLKSGETLGVLSKRYGVSVEQIMAANNITDARKIRAGQKLIIPGGRGAAPAPAPAAAAPAPAPAPAITTPPPSTTEPIPVTNDLLPETQPAIPADITDAPPIPVDEPTPTP